VRLAFDEQIFAIQSYGGISRVFAELAAAFSSESVTDLDLLPINAAIVNRYLLDSDELRTQLQVRQARNQWTALFRYATRLPSHRNADVVHNTFYLPQGLASIGGAARIVTIHDMIPELLPHTRRRLDFITLKKRYVESADHIICVSEATKQDLIKVYGPPSVPVTVVHHGVDPRFHPVEQRHHRLPERYVLFVGHRGQYKDARVLFRAFAELAKEDPSINLVCVGGDGFSPAETRQIEYLGIGARVTQHFLSDEEMISAYSHALAFVFPSHFEGFGLPALEAMACGAPVVLAAASSLPEVGGDAALYFEPGSVDDLARVLRALLTDDAARSKATQLGLDRAAEFTWRRAACATARVYREALAAPK
jgi:glycosyltransferase involved in cell wall biosynthesis